MSKQEVTQVEIARRVGLDVSSVNKILNQTPGPVFREETIEKVVETAREMGYDFKRIKHRHRRHHPRRAANIPSKILVFRRDGTLYDEGEGTIHDIGPAGASIGGLQLPNGCLPAEPFSVLIRPRRGPLKFLELRGRVARIVVGEEMVLGLNFSDLDPRIRSKVEKFASSG